jgi:hypothetical protein
MCRNLGPRNVIAWLLGMAIVLTASSAAAETLANAAYRLEVTPANGSINVTLFDKTMNLPIADGPYLYRAKRQRGATKQQAAGLTNAKIAAVGDKLTIRGELAGLELEHTFTLPGDRPIVEEQIVLHNKTGELVALTDFEAGLTRRVTDKSGKVLPELAAARVVAVPFRHRATDAKGHFNDFSIHDLVTQPGSESWVSKDQAIYSAPSRHRWSEGWAVTVGKHTLGIFSFNQENMLFSVLSTVAGDEGKSLRLGGAVMLQGEPAALTRIAPGASVDLGTTRFETIEGGYPEAMYAYRAMLDDKGCRFPKDFNPPVHWEQLYDMDGAWEDRLHRYTKEIIEREAAKGRDYSCEALYLDPGWDTDFATFLWGEKWLGSRKQFIDEMRSKYGLKVSLHTPLATWMSHTGISWGIGAVETYPPEARRTPPAAECRGPEAVPAVRDGRRNLALLPAAKANASSLFAQGKWPIHQTVHLNDGWYGNDASWIADKLPAWAEIDLGAEYEIGEVRLGNDHLGRFNDRGITQYKILAATKYNADSQSADWRTIAAYSGAPLTRDKVFRFPATAARWVRVAIQKTEKNDEPRLDEIEIYEAKPVSASAAAAFAKNVKRRPTHVLVCLGSKQYLAVAEERLLANCADGVAFLMFDGNWYNGGCDNPNHGHPVPYTKEDHIRANLDLAQRIHAKYPNVVIEMHDMLCGGSPWRLTPIYYKYGLPGSYDDNWGFELMWGPMDDIQQGRGLALYYSNMGCNVPIYTHVNLSGDNAHCLILWWYASTCRHLGIGGKHADAKIVTAQQQAMKWYRARDRFYKRGDFYGIDEEIHLHVLPAERAFVVNAFNLSDKTRTIRGQIDLKTLGLDPKTEYVSPDGLGAVENGRYRVSVELPPWGTKVGEVRAKK